MMVRHLEGVANVLRTLLEQEKKRFDHAIDHQRNFEEIKTRGKEIRQLEKQINWYNEKINLFK